MLLDKRVPISKVPFFNSKEIVIGGFIETIRKLRKITFLVVRDFTDSVQVVFSGKELPPLSRESVVLVRGTVSRKASKDAFEIIGSELELLSGSRAIPIELGKNNVSDEKFRMKYRYLDLRREELKRNLVFSSKARFIASSFLHSREFTEVTTPILSFSSREGAQTFSTLPILNLSESFTLAQSPQIYKQLLMIGGFNSYFQFSTSFRAEKLREERQFEFTQLDIELSFSTRENLFQLIEELLLLICKKLLGLSFPYSSFPRLKYETAMSQYGSDKPDTRFPSKIVNLFEGLPRDNAIPFEYCYALLIDFKPLDKLEKVFQEAKGKFNYIHRTAEQILGGEYDDWIIDYSTHLCREPKKEYWLFYRCTNRFLRERNLLDLGRLRLILSRYDPKRGEWEKGIPYSFVWIVDWPYFQDNPDGSLKTAHHPFTLPIVPVGEKSNYRKWGSTAYDLVLNGAEIASGSQRITDYNQQKKLFEILGYTEEEIDKSFGWFIEALQYGVPPHLGIAIGWERLIKELLKVSSIREVIAFPKNSHGVCSMSSGSK